jgi:DNA-nicking Smr family endonuclease
MSSNPPSRKRPLTAEEAELWSFAMREAKALRREKERHHAAALRSHGDDHSPAAAPEAAEPPGACRKTAAPAPRPAPSYQPPQQPKLPPPLAAYNQRERRKLSRDAEMIDARLDLHGMRQREAHGALKRFLLACHGRGDRHVLVITGKGAPGEAGLRGGYAFVEERGVLRRQVPQWLAEPEMRGIVVGYSTASARHGGDGALYVRLRKAPAVG